MKVGFLGGGNPHALAIARHFTEQGIDCFGIGRRPAKAAPLWLVPKGYRYYEANLQNSVGVMEFLVDQERPDFIVCVAAQGEGAASFGSDCWRFYETNCVMLARLVESLRTRDYLKRFIHIGTSELYGSVDTPATETFPIRATSPYSISKSAFDMHLEVMHKVHGFQVNIVRPSNCLTSGMQLHRIVPRAAISAVYGQRLKLQGGGVARKSFLDTEDLARGILTVIEKGTVGEIYNCGPTDPISIKNLVKRVAQEAGVYFKDFVDEVPGRIGEDSCYQIDSTKLRALGWSPQVSLGKALERMVQWVRDYPVLATMPYEYKVTP